MCVKGINFASVSTIFLWFWNWGNFCFWFYYLVFCMYIKSNISNKLKYEVLLSKWALGLGGIMVFNTTFNNISVILWRPVLLVKESRIPGENHQPVASLWQSLSHNVVSSTPRLSGIWTHNVNGDRHRLERWL